METGWQYKEAEQEPDQLTDSVFKRLRAIKVTM